jgi:hypothetical protein
MKRSKHRIGRSLALATVVGALAAPAAMAYPVDKPLPPTPSAEPKDEPYVGSVTALAPPTHAAPLPSTPSDVSGEGFDWGDAGIGATAMLGLTTIAAGSAIVVGRRSRRGQSVA